MKRVAIYCRVSTTDKGQTNENQILAIKEYAARHTDWKTPHVYEDCTSGAIFARQGLDKLKDDCRKGKLDIIIVWKLDRLGRSTIDLLNTLAFFTDCKVDFVSVTESLDSSTPSGRLLLVLIAALAEFERSIIKERVKLGLDRAKATGVHLGRPRRGFDITRAVELKNAGKSYCSIANELGLPVGTVFNYLSKLIQKTPVNLDA